MKNLALFTWQPNKDFRMDQLVNTQSSFAKTGESLKPESDTVLN